GAATCVQPVAMSHESVVQTLPSSQFGGRPGAHMPCESQTSLPLQALPSGQGRFGTGAWLQCAWQGPADTSVASQHTLSDVHEVGQAPAPLVMPVSQSSPESTTPLPQLGEQSGSVALVAPVGQHPSAGPMAVMVVCVQCA